MGKGSGWKVPSTPSGKFNLKTVFLSRHLIYKITIMFFKFSPIVFEVTFENPQIRPPLSAQNWAVPTAYGQPGGDGDGDSSGERFNNLNGSCFEDEGIERRRRARTTVEAFSQFSGA